MDQAAGPPTLHRRPKRGLFTAEARDGGPPEEGSWFPSLLSLFLLNALPAATVR